MTSSLRRSLRRSALVTLALLLIPLAAMHVTSEVNWGIEDFVAGGLLLFTAGMVYSIAAHRTHSRARRIGIAILVLGVLGTVWVHLAAGLF